VGKLTLERFARRGRSLLGQPKVGQLQVATGVHEEVVALEVAVNVTELVQGVDSGAHLGGPLASLGLVQLAYVVKEGPYVTARYVVHCKVDGVKVLKGIV
jgi:hypothetical protein